MELEEMKNLWEEMSADIEKQKKLTDSLIIKMTQLNYYNKVSKIFVPEAVGSAICFAMVGFIIINIEDLNAWYLIVSGIISALILIILPVSSIRSIYKIRSLNISANNYKQSLIAYSTGKKQFVAKEKMSFYLGAILMVLSLPVTSKLIAGKDIFKAGSAWYWYIIIVFPFFYWFSKWVSRCYMNTLASAENILKEIEG